MSEAMSHAEEVVRSMCERYASAVNANDSMAYSKLFTQDAVRIPPGSDPEYVRTKFERANRPTTTSPNGASGPHP